MSLIKEDIDFILESEKMNILEFSEKTKVSRTTLDSISKNTKPRDDVYEKTYSYAYENKCEYLSNDLPCIK